MNLFETIKVIQPVLPGWCHPEKAEALAAMVLSIRPKVTLEIGIYGGSSFIPLALAHKEIGVGMCWGIDPWSLEASIQGEMPDNVEFWSKQDYEKLYTDFMRKLKELDLESCTHILRMKSDNVDPPLHIDILHVDGNHSEPAYRDFVRFAPNVRKGGFCVVDDEHWSQGNVERGCAKLLALGYERLYSLGTGAVFQRL